MPWKEHTIVEERMRFVVRLLEGEEMSFLCREFGISRKTGYKIYDRYKECGLEALTDRSRRPFRYGNQLPFQVETAIVQLKKEKPCWGARKLRERLQLGSQSSRRQHHPRRSGSPWPGRTHGSPKTQSHRDASVNRRTSQRPLVCGFPRRVQTRKPKVLLPPHRDRLRQSLSAFV